MASWTSCANASILRDHGTSGVISGILYVVGGGESGTLTERTDGYNPSTNTWTNYANDLVARESAAAGVIGSKLYVVGGYTSGGEVGTNNAYDSGSNTWASLLADPQSRMAAIAGVVSGLLYVVGGSFGGPFLSVMNVFTPGTDTWASATAHPTTPADGTAQTSGGVMYVADGIASDNYGYNPGTTLWTAYANDLNIQTGAVSGLLYGVVYVVSTTYNNGYTIAANTWASYLQNTASVNSASGGVISGILYVVGGLDQPGNTPDWESYGFNPATAPNATSLTSPGNSAYIDAVSGVTFAGVYNSADNASANARALRMKMSGASSYNYWNQGTGAWQSSIVWNPVTIANGASGSFGPITASLADGTTINWSMADQESLANMQGVFPSDFTVNLQQGPTLTISAPVGTVTATSQPSLAYNPTPGAGSSVTNGRWLVYTAAAAGAPGFTINIGAGTIPAGAISDVSWTGNPLTVDLQSGVSLMNGTSYIAFAAVEETGSIWSSTISTAFTQDVTEPATPTITATAGTDPSTGAPRVAIVVQGHDNLLSTDDASFEGSIGTWVPGAGTSIARSNAASEDGSYSLAITSL